MSKFTNYTVIDPQYTTPPWKADGIFQTWQPVSGDYNTSSNFCGNDKKDTLTNQDVADAEIPSNQTGRGFTGNNKGYFNKNEYFPQVTPGFQFENETAHSKLYPYQIGNLTSVSVPQDRVFRSAVRIGYNWRN